jgi:hypothetical protein
VEVISQIDYNGFYSFSDSVIFVGGRYVGAVTISNVTFQDCKGGLEIWGGADNASTIAVNIDNLKTRNMKASSMRSIVYILDVGNVNISNMDIDSVDGDTYSLILIGRVKNNVGLENVAIKNIGPPYGSGGNRGIIMMYDTGYTVFNNCYFESSGTSPNIGSFVNVYNDAGYMNLTIRNTRFNFKNQNPNLMAVRALRGFNLENVSFENSVSTTLLSIDGNYPYQLKRSGSFYNGVSLSDNATFSALNARIQSTNGAVLTAVP